MDQYHPESHQSMPIPVYHSQPLTGVDTPHDNDVLCGRGVTTNRHPGNESFRSLVNCNKELYVTSTKKQKMKISRSIVLAVRSLEPQGRFLEKDQQSGKWFDIGDKKAVEKTSQALRDGAAGLRKQLSEDLGDPDFLSAVFDMDMVSSEKKSVPTVPPTKKEKKLPVKKGHRRVKSNPTMGGSKAKHHAKRSFHPGEMPSSPRPQRHQSIHIPCSMKPPPPHSPIMSPRSSPRAGMHYHSVPHGSHRRVHSQSSVPIQIPSLPNSPVNFGPPSPYHRAGPPAASGPPLAKAHSYDYHDSMEHSRPPPPRFGSPSPHHYPAPLSPRGHPPVPYGMQPRSPYHPPHVSPRWSPRNGYARPAHNTLSPHPYQHPSDFYRRPSPDRRPLLLSPRDLPISPREPYSRTHGYPSRNVPSSPSSNSHLAVPSLGSEQVSSHHGHPPLSPRYPSPRNHNSPSASRSPTLSLSLPQHIYSHGSQSPQHIRSYGNESFIPKEFTPPESPALRLDTSSYCDDHHEAPMPMEEDMVEEKKDEQGDNVDLLKQQERDREKDCSVPFDENQSLRSPSAVADVATSSSTIIKEMPPSETEREKDEEDYPFDEEQNPALDSSGAVSPLPFDDQEDPGSIMALPENLLSLPISPCGPTDGDI